MLKVEAWAKNRNPAFAYIAIRIALTARDRCEALQHIKERRLYGHEFPLPDFPSWFALYKSPFKSIRAFKRILPEPTDLDKENIFLYSGFRRLGKVAARSPEPIQFNCSKEDLKGSFEYWEDMLSRLFEEIREDMVGSSVDPDQKKKFLEQLAKDELLLGFYFLVHIPSQLFYEESPQSLYKKALERNIDAMDKLLKLDPLLIHDHSIGHQIQWIRLHGRKNDYEKLMASVNKYPRTSYSNLTAARKSVKSDYGGMIAAFAHVCNIKFHIPEVRQLYDDLARNYNGSDDLDIGSPEGFDRTVKNKMKQWQDKFRKTENKK